MKKDLFYLDYYVRCGEMPLYLLFYRNKSGRPMHCAMLCTMKNLRQLLRKRKGFTDPKQYGQVVYQQYDEKPNEELVGMLKSRYYYDLSLNQLSPTEEA